MKASKILLKIFILFLIFSSYNLYGQSPKKNNISHSSIKPLTIGDKVPDFTITNMKNFSSDKMQLSKLKAKLIIVDFWNQWCGACIDGMPKMQKLKEKFGDQLEVFLVTEQTQKDLQRSFQTSPILKQTTLPFVFSDTIFHKLFLHLAKPYHVWISGDGVVKAMTAAWNSTEKNVEDFLAGKNIELPVRKDAMDFNLSASLLTEGNGRLLKHTNAYSLFIPGKLPETPKSLSASINDSVGNMVGMRFLSTPVLYLYHFAFNVPENTKIVVEGRDTSDYYEPSPTSDSWMEKSVVNYEFSIAANVLPDKNGNMNTEEIERLQLEKCKSVIRKDLYRFCELSASYEIRPMKHWIITKIEGGKTLHSKGGEKVVELAKDGLVLRNQPFRIIPDVLSTSYMHGPSHPIIIDKTGIEENIDIILPIYQWGPAGRPDLFTIQKTLQEYGLRIREEQLDAQVLILRKIIE